MEEKFPRVGIGVIVIKDKKVLLGKRKNSHGDGCWQFPGGHLEFNEDPIDCAKREVFEEVGIKIKNCRIGPYTNDIFKDETRHYITIFIICDYERGEVEVKEADKAERWDWFSWDTMPKPYFLPITNLLRKGYNPFN